MKLNRIQLRRLIENTLNEKEYDDSNIENFESGQELEFDMGIDQDGEAADNKAAFILTQNAASIAWKQLDLKPKGKYYLWMGKDLGSGLEFKLGNVRYSQGDPYTYREEGKDKDGDTQYRVMSGPYNKGKRTKGRRKGEDIGTTPIGALFTPKSPPTIIIEPVPGPPEAADKAPGSYVYAPDLTPAIDEVVETYSRTMNTINGFVSAYSAQKNKGADALMGYGQASDGGLNVPNWANDWKDLKDLDLINDLNSLVAQLKGYSGNIKRQEIKGDFSEYNFYDKEFIMNKYNALVPELSNSLTEFANHLNKIGPKLQSEGRRAGSVWGAAEQMPELKKKRDLIKPGLQQLSGKLSALVKVGQRIKNDNIPVNKVQQGVEAAKSSGPQSVYAVIRENKTDDNYSRGYLYRRRYRRY